MHALDQVEQLLSQLSPAEKARLLQRLARDIGHSFPGIERTPGIAGGEPCIVRTRIPVWVLAEARRLGASEADRLHMGRRFRPPGATHSSGSQLERATPGPIDSNQSAELRPSSSVPHVAIFTSRFVAPFLLSEGPEIHQINLRC